MKQKYKESAVKEITNIVRGLSSVLGRGKRLLSAVPFQKDVHTNRTPITNSPLDAWACEFCRLIILEGLTTH